MVHLTHMPPPRLPRSLVLFLAVGLCGLTADLTLLWALEHEGLSHVMARGVSLTVATGVTWLLNRAFTFGASGRRRSVEFGRYGLVAVLAQGLNYLLFLGIVAAMPGLSHSLAAIAGAVTAAGFSYCGQRFFTFARMRRD